MKQRINAIPAREELAELCKTMTLDQLADHYETYPRRVWNWLHKYGLKQVLKPPGRERKDIDIEYVCKCIRSGMLLQSIADGLNVSSHTISSRLKEAGLSVKQIKKDSASEKNKGYNCKPYGQHNCKYWSKGAGCCDYILRTGHKRPCPPWNCTVYEKGKGKRENGWSINGEREDD